MADDPAPPGFPRLESAARAIQTLTIPLITLALVALFFRPLLAVADNLPAMVSKASEISGAGFSLKIREAAEKAGHPEVADAVGGLSKPAVRQLLAMNDATNVLPVRDGLNNTLSLPAADRLAVYLELEKAGLLNCGERRIDQWRQDFTAATDPAPTRFDAQARRVKPQFNPDDYPYDFSCRLSQKGSEAAGVVLDAVADLATRPG